MATYNAETGKWDEDSPDVEKNSVQGRMAGLLSTDSDYMKQAETAGLQQANKRGLLNSSIAVGAAESSRIAAALPIASQDSSQANQRQMQGRGLQDSDIQQGKQIASTEKLTGQQLDTQKQLQASQIASTEKQQGTAISANQTLQDREIANSQWSKQFDAATQQALQGVDIASREKMQQAGFTQAQILQQSEQQNQQWLAQFDADTRTKLQGLDAQTRLGLQQLDIQSQEKIANMNVGENQRAEAARMATSFEVAYQGMLATIMNNPDIPADARQSYIDHANTVRQSNLSLVEQMFQIKLEWQP